jgi:PHP family Zn ribbon phosphoesterase
MRSLLVDLHLHTVLSACAEIEMIPPLIVQRAHALGLDVIAITDHNSADNAGAVMQAAQASAGSDLTVLPGMEVTSREEAHMVTLFDTLDQVQQWQQIVHAALPPLKNKPELFGEQYVVDATGKYLRTEERLLATATSLSVEQIVDRVNCLGGICLAAHVDRPSNSIVASLGFIPPELKIAGIELSGLTTLKKTVQFSAVLGQWGRMINGDAHRLSDMKAQSRMRVAEPTVSEIRLALEREQGRGVELVASRPI